MRPSDEIIDNAIEIESLNPYCNKLDIEIDRDKVWESFNQLFISLGLDYDTFIKTEFESCMEAQKNQPIEDRGYFWELPLSHLPGVTGLDRLYKHRGTIEMLADMGIHDRMFTETLDELKVTYLYKIIQSVYVKHKETTGRDFVGKIHCLWLNGNERYELHTDYKHNPIRYHIPIVTNKDVFWIFRDKTDESKYYKLHMDVGTVWQFYPLEILHSVVNNSNIPRVHLIVSECLE